MSTRRRSPQFLISRLATRSLCKKCKRIVLDGIDMGLPYRLTPIPLNSFGEQTALLCGLACYRLIMQNGYFSVRTLSDIRADNKSGRPLVLAEHLCGETVLESIDFRYLAEIEALLDRLSIQTDMNRQDHDAFLLLRDEAGALVMSEQEEPPF